MYVQNVPFSPLAYFGADLPLLGLFTRLAVGNFYGQIELLCIVLKPTGVVLWVHGRINTLLTYSLQISLQNHESC